MKLRQPSAFTCSHESPHVGRTSVHSSQGGGEGGGGVGTGATGGTGGGRGGKGDS